MGRSSSYGVGQGYGNGDALGSMVVQQEKCDKTRDYETCSADPQEPANESCRAP